MTRIEMTINDETKMVAFTEPQAKIMERLLEGETVTYNSNDTLVWDNGNFRECVGVRAFNGAMDKVCKAFGLTHEEECMMYDKYIS